MNEKNMENLNPQKKKKGVLIGCSIGILVLLVVCVVGFFIWNSSHLKPKTVFTTAIKNVYERSKNDTDLLKKGLMGSQLSISTDLKSDEKDVNSLLEILNKMNITMDVKVNAQDKRMQLKLNSTYNQKDLLNAKLNLVKNTFYIDLDSLYDKTLSTPAEAESFFELFSKGNDLTTVIESIYKALEASLKDEYFTQEKETLTIQGKEVKTNKSTLLLNEENAKKILKSITEELNNDTCLSALANLTTTDKEEIKASLEEYISEIEEIEIEDPISISIYSYGIKNEFAGIVIKDSVDSFSILKTEENTYTYKINVEDTNYTGTITYQENKDTVDCSITIDIEGIRGTITLKTKTYNQIQMDEIDFSNTISIEELSESDQMTILENVQKQDGLMELIEGIQALTNASM